MSYTNKKTQTDGAKNSIPVKKETAKQNGTEQRLKHTHTLTDKDWFIYFPDEPSLTGCPMRFLSPLVP